MIRQELFLPPSSLKSPEMRLCSSFYLVFPVVVILDEVQNEVENLFRTEVLDVSEQRHGNRHRLSQETETTQREAKALRRAGAFREGQAPSAGSSSGS